MRGWGVLSGEGEWESQTHLHFVDHCVVWPEHQLSQDPPAVRVTGSVFFDSRGRPTAVATRPIIVCPRTGLTLQTSGSRGMGEQSRAESAARRAVGAGGPSRTSFEIIARAGSSTLSVPCR